MNPDDDLDRLRAEFIARRDAVFREPTLERAIEFDGLFNHAERADAPLAGVHKARLQWLDATDAMLAESIAWLTSHGYETSWRGAPPLTPEQRDADRARIGKPPLAQSAS
jgi:hypothetical protein